MNLIYEDTLVKMQIDRGRIKQSSTTFRGIIPSREARCSGKIKLDVVFGTPENYRSEELIFQVAPFNSGYHALLGRDAFTRFQAIPHYGYMKLKMPGPNGVITIASDPKTKPHPWPSRHYPWPLRPRSSPLCAPQWIKMT